MDGGEHPTQRLAVAIRGRRRQLGLSLRAAAELAGLARNTWMAAEEGTRRTSDANYSKIERALQWSAGSVEALLAGGDPIEQDMWPSPATANEADDLARIAALPVPATRKLDMMRTYLEVLAQAQEEAREDAAESG